MLSDERDADVIDVAVIGMACRFPGADGVDGFWELLCTGREGLSRFERAQLAAAGVPPQLLADPRFVGVHGVVPDADVFDSGFFEFTPAEAELTDPQHRLFLQFCHAALEDAGYDPHRYPGLISVYGGAAINTYLQQNVLAHVDQSVTSRHFQLMVGNDKDFLATRVAYKLDLKGPAYTVQTACSTSLVAVHLACQGLLNGECDIALAGGVTVKFPQVKGYLYEEGAILAADGTVRAFDAAATGTVPGNGVGVVVLKPLAQALADGDTVHAVIKGTAVNNDGAKKVSFAAPGREGQVAVISEAHQVSGVHPDTIGYVEAHGTGTRLGDPVEVAALTEAFRRQTRRTGYCGIGSVKTNLGHLDAAAGVASLIKATLMLRHRTMVPTLNFTRPNPAIDFPSTPFYVVTDSSEWTTDGGPRRAGVSSFGIGGTNAHLVLEEAPAVVRRPAGRSAELIVLSARTGTGLERATANLARHLKAHPELSLADVAFTLGAGRAAREHRLALVCTSVRDAALTLALADRNRLVTGAPGTDRPEVAFAAVDRLGDGGAHALALLTEVPAFAEAAREVTGDPEAALRADDASAAFVAQYALLRLLDEWGVEITTVTGAPVAGLLTAVAEGRITPSDALTRLDGDWSAAPPTGDGPVFSPVPAEPGLAGLLRAVAELWVAGADVDWARVLGGPDRGRIPLPTYPFERQRYWAEPAGRAAVAPGGGPNLRDQLADADDETRLDLLIGFVQQQISRVLGGNVAAPDPDRSLFEMGLDSLILIDITARLTEELEETIDASAFVEHPTIREFVGHQARALGLVAETDVDGGTTTGRTSRRAAQRRGAPR